MGAIAILVAIAATFSPASAAQRARAPKPRAQKTAPAPAASPKDAVTAVEALAAEAEAALREGEVQIAESRYRDALMAGWMLIGALETNEHRPKGARDAFRRATMSAVAAEGAQRSLAMALLQTGEAAEALPLLSRLAVAAPRDGALRRLLAQALIANGQSAQAVQELEEARGILPDDLELAFALASGYLRIKKVEPAERLFETIAKSRPLPTTYVLIGRTYRDYGEYPRARAALQRALKMDPRARRAHYYLGTVAIMEQGYERADEAIAEFRAELTIAPRDPVTHLRLGIVLEEAKRHAEALPSLELAARDPAAGSDAFEYLGRCQLALEQTAEGAGNLQRALEGMAGTSPERSRVGRLHYQLATALRRLGRNDEAASHFAEAQSFSEERTEDDRARLQRYLADTAEPEDTSEAVVGALGSGPFGSLSADARAAIRRRLTDALARAYLNLGIVQVRANRFARAATFFEGAAAADPAFPQVQYSLGVAYFNAQQFAKATAPLERAAAEAGPTQVEARRMLALSWLNREAWDKAESLLKDDPRRASDASLQYAYALALVRSGRAEQAQEIFSQLLTSHGDSPELNVLLGQAHGQQGDYEAAIESLNKALSLKPDVREANAALGFIYFKQGRLDEAAAALRAELKAHPDESSAMQTLATVLDLQGSPEQAVPLLRSALKLRPDFADARYLLGKILLAQGSTAEAIYHLEAGARLAPEDANIHFQLAQAYQKSGQTALAEREFARYRELKDKKREGSR